MPLTARRRWRPPMTGAHGSAFLEMVVAEPRDFSVTFATRLSARRCFAATAKRGADMGDMPFLDGHARALRAGERRTFNKNIFGMLAIFGRKLRNGTHQEARLICERIISFEYLRLIPARKEPASFTSHFTPLRRPS